MGDRNRDRDSEVTNAAGETFDDGKGRGGRSGARRRRKMCRFCADDTVTILKIRQKLKGNNITLSSTAGTSIFIDKSGFTPNSSGTFSLCDERGADYGKSISIANTGRIRNGGTVTC